MPVTAKLSRAFYEKLGDDVANELVDWFNSVDLTYRNDLRELADLQYARFDAKLEQRIGALEARFEGLEAKFEGLKKALDLKLEAIRAEIAATLATQRADLLKWMFLFWAGTVAPLAGLIIALHQLR